MDFHPIDEDTRRAHIDNLINAAISLARKGDNIDMFVEALFSYFDREEAEDLLSMFDEQRQRVEMSPEFLNHGYPVLRRQP